MPEFLNFEKFGSQQGEFSLAKIFFQNLLQSSLGLPTTNHDVLSHLQAALFDWRPYRPPIKRAGDLSTHPRAQLKKFLRGSAFLRRSGVPKGLLEGLP